MKQNPLLTASEVRDILVSEDLLVPSLGTIQGWAKKAERAAVRDAAQEQQPSTGPSWEQIVEAAPGVEALANLLFQGFMSKLDEKDSAYGVLKQENLRLQDELAEARRERDKIASEFNEKLAKAKIGTLTIDQVQHKLFRKER